MAKTREINTYFSTKAIVALCHILNALVSKRRTLLSWKVVNRYKFSDDKNFGGFLDLMTSTENALFSAKGSDRRKYVCFRRLRSHLPYISKTLETWNMKINWNSLILYWRTVRWQALFYLGEFFISYFRWSDASVSFNNNVRWLPD